MKKKFNCLLLVTFLMTAIFPAIIFADEPGGGTSGLTVDTSAVWTNDEKTAADVYINAHTTSTPAMVIPKVLFIGSLCLAHGMSNNTLVNTINALAKKGDVTYFTCNTGDSYSLGKCGTLEKDGTLTENFGLRSSNHSCSYSFEKILYDELVLNGNSYDLIVLEFDSTLLYGGSYVNSTQGSELKTALKPFYEENKCFWVTDSGYFSTSSLILNPGASQKSENCITYGNCSNVVNFVNNIEVWPKYDLTFIDAISSDFDVKGAELQVYEDGEWKTVQENVSSVNGKVQADITELTGAKEIRLVVHLTGDSYRESSVAGTNTLDPSKAGSASVTMISGDTIVTEEAVLETSEAPLTWEAYEIRTSKTTGGTIDSNKIVAEGLDKTIHYSPNAHYKLDEVIVDGVQVDIAQHPNSYTFTNIQENHNIQVKFSHIMRQVETEAVKGYIDESTSVIDGSNLTISFTPNTYYMVDKVLVNSQDAEWDRENNKITLENITENKAIKVICVPKPVYKINKNITGGTIDSKDECTADSSMVVNFEPNNYFHILSVSVNNEKVDYETSGNGGYFTLLDVNEEKNIDIICEQDKYDLKTTAVNGTITEAGEMLGGEDTTVSYEPNDGYKLAKIVVDGEELTDLSLCSKNYTFETVTSDHNIEVTYEKVKEPYVPFTGDDDGLLLYGILGFISLIGIFIISPKKLRRN